MKRILAVAIASVALSVPTVAATSSAASAAPDKRPCVTKGEWVKIKKGMRVNRVTSILDTRGYYTYRDYDTFAPYVDVYRYYRGCGSLNQSYLEINFFDGRVWSKTAHWVRS